MADEEVIIDTAQVENLRQLFNDEFNNFIQTFLTDFEEKEKILVAAIQKNELDTITKTAHLLKGSSLNMGAMRLGKICLKIEIAGKENNLNDIHSHLQDLEKIYSDTKAAFQSLMQ